VTEEEAKRLLGVPRETLSRLEIFVELLIQQNEHQNLVSRGTLPEVWERHILDSRQLLRFAPRSGTWLDLGTGAGFPGLIVAALWEGQVALVESRRLRVDFLRAGAEVLGVSERTEILSARVETLARRPFDVISARAFAPLDKLLRLGVPFSTEKTVWILPKGRNAQSELDAVRSSWQGDFRVEPSLTDAEAGIIVATGVKPKGKKSR
jgi:16S rRNA (guanine527-N7)-methyltransferase